MKVHIAWMIPCIHLVQLVRCESQQMYDVEGVPFWANRGRRGEDVGPFWANRGRRMESKTPVISNEHTEWNTRVGEPLYVEEPHWILVRRDDERTASRSVLLPEFEPFFVTRGKREHPEVGLNRAMAPPPNTKCSNE